MSEQWKSVAGYEGLYEVSNRGRVKSLRRTVVFKDGRRRIAPERIVKRAVAKTGYLVVNLWRNNRGIVHYVHRLVAIAFIPNPHGAGQVNHIDFNRENADSHNLEWVSLAENVDHTVSHGRHRYPGLKGEAHPMAKLTWTDVVCMRDARANGESMKTIASRYNVSLTHAYRIVSSKAWCGNRHHEASHASR